MAVRIYEYSLDSLQNNNDLFRLQEQANADNTRATRARITSQGKFSDAADGTILLEMYTSHTSTLADSVNSLVRIFFLVQKTK